MRGDRVERRAEIRQRRLPIRGWGGGLRTRPTGRHRVNVVGEQARRRSARSLPRSRLEGIQWAVISARHALPWCWKRVVQLHVKLSPRGEAGNRNKHDSVRERWEWLPIRNSGRGLLYYKVGFFPSTDLQAQLRGPQQALDRFGEGQRVPAAGGARGVRLVRRRRRLRRAVRYVEFVDFIVTVQLPEPGRNPSSASMTVAFCALTEKYTRSAPSGSLRRAMKKMFAASSFGHTPSTFSALGGSPETSCRCSAAMPFH